MQPTESQGPTHALRLRHRAPGAIIPSWQALDSNSCWHWPWLSVSAEGIFLWQNSSDSGDLYVERTDGHVLGPAVSVGSQSFDGAQFLLSSIIAF